MEVFLLCPCSLEAKDPERVSAGVEPPRGVRAGPGLLWLPFLLPLLQTAAGRTLQAAALQTGEYCQLWKVTNPLWCCRQKGAFRRGYKVFLKADGERNALRLQYFTLSSKYFQFILSFWGSVCWSFNIRAGGDGGAGLKNNTLILTSLWFLK